MLNQYSLSTLLLVIFFLHGATASGGQSPAPAPAPSGPINIVSVLKKAAGGRYSTFIRLLKSTQIDDQINSQLNELDQALTVFAPTDSAFSKLKPGMLNSLTDQQKFQLVQFHVVPSFLSIPQFQTVSNPLRTQAGGGTAQFPLNVTMAGNQVNLTTGLENTSLADTVYSDDNGRLAVYEIDRVLISEGLFRPPAPAPLPPNTRDPSDAPSGSDGASSSDDDHSDANNRPDYAQNLVSLGVALIVPLQLWL